MLKEFAEFLVLVLLFALNVAGIDSQCPESSDADYDFIVVGAGAGGGPLAARLAENGYSVLLVDAGHEVTNFNTTIALFFARALDDPQMELNYTLDEYPPGFKFQKDNTWYPRARGFGGCTLHDAAINIIAESQGDFNSIADMFDDPSWTRDNMQNYFKKLENNLYSLPLDPNHGFNGWLSTSGLPIDILLERPEFLDLQILTVAVTQILSELPVDLNDRQFDQYVGNSMNSFVIGSDHTRSSVSGRISQSSSNGSGKLSLSPDTLATRVLLCSSTGGSVSAYGVEIAPGAGLAVASNFDGQSNLQLKNVTARHEVIVSAGTFQSPQILMLSGIGDSSQLSQHGIETVVNLPGVGKNLQDHDEISMIWKLKSNFSIFTGCTFLTEPDRDPCLADWIQSNHRNPYSFGATLGVQIAKSEPDYPEPDVLTYWGPGYFPGFVRGVGQLVADNHNALTAVALKAHPSSRGTVELTGSHPQDPLNIQKQRFQAPNGPQDVADLRSAIKRARAFVESTLIEAFVDEEVMPGPDIQTDDELDDFIYQNIFGHHACCTNPIGADSDPNAVLDGDFRVRGVENLRVVDASSWPNVPGYFIRTLTYMISEKAADVILDAATAN